MKTSKSLKDLHLHFPCRLFPLTAWLLLCVVAFKVEMLRASLSFDAIHVKVRVHVHALQSKLKLNVC